MHRRLHGKYYDGDGKSRLTMNGRSSTLSELSTRTGSMKFRSYSFGGVWA